MCDKMAISTHILKTVENDTLLRFQMKVKGQLLIFEQFWPIFMSTP